MDKNQSIFAGKLECVDGTINPIVTLPIGTPDGTKYITYYSPVFTLDMLKNYDGSLYPVVSVVGVPDDNGRVYELNDKI